jgi:hypothetical protein
MYTAIRNMVVTTFEKLVTTLSHVVPLILPQAYSLLASFRL